MPGPGAGPATSGTCPRPQGRGSGARVAGMARGQGSRAWIGGNGCYDHTPYAWTVRLSKRFRSPLQSRSSQVARLSPRGGREARRCRERPRDTTADPCGGEVQGPGAPKPRDPGTQGPSGPGPTAAGSPPPRLSEDDGRGHRCLRGVTASAGKAAGMPFLRTPRPPGSMALRPSGPPALRPSGPPALRLSGPPAARSGPPV
jgi:hypothetical protein